MGKGVVAMYLDNVTTLENYIASPASRRHGELTRAFDIALNGYTGGGALLSRETQRLVYYGGFGSEYEYSLLSLVDVAGLDDFDAFRRRVINDLNTVEPDIMFFKDSKFVENETQTRVAGRPDLIVEVWSPSNTLYDKQRKFDIYSTSDITEHWYVEQDSNLVVCYIGKMKLPSQCLGDVLATQKGLKLDLCGVAL